MSVVCFGVGLFVVVIVPLVGFGIQFFLSSSFQILLFFVSIDSVVFCEHKANHPCLLQLPVGPAGL